ncbi:hypothetical protein [Nocardia transvalensis]|uniref:hypothetical protein n=1 Tax=Nocardia transvalensis TaxID=37333 RepID=UPI0018953933|nr:hypothetical protein [Nocardia transvalensis]MBF6328421.1 hypothetical protein [Nocardia transvalensis]
MKAIGFVDKELSGTDQGNDERQIREYARNNGFDLARTLAAGSSRTKDHIVDLLNLVRKLGADAVLVPRLQHFDGRANAVLTFCRVVDTASGTVWERGQFVWEREHA